MKAGEGCLSAGWRGLHQQELDEQLNGVMPREEVHASRARSRDVVLVVVGNDELVQVAEAVGAKHCARLPTCAGVVAAIYHDALAVARRYERAGAMLHVKTPPRAFSRLGEMGWSTIFEGG